MTLATAETVEGVPRQAPARAAVERRPRAARAASPAQSLQARISAAILLTVMTVLFVGCTLFMIEQHRAETVLDRQVHMRMSEALAADEAAPFAAGNDAQIARDLRILAHSRSIVSVELKALDGRTLSFQGLAGPGRRTQTYRTPLRLGGRTIGEFTSVALPPPSGIAFSHYLAMGGALFFAATALALFLGRWLAARITTPVARLSAAMEAVGSSGAFKVRVEAGTGDEIGRLIAGFNDLMARLQVKDTALRKTLAELVEARDAAEAANLAKSQFLANMSHEIRTPLNGVLAMAQILERSGLEPVQHDQVEVIRHSGETLLSLLNDILDVSKIEAGKLELEIADFDAAAVAESAAAGFAGVAQRKAVALVVEVTPEARGLWRGDAGRLRQILNNFLSNALKFTEAGSVRLEVGAGEDGLRLAVRDTGMGIPTDKLPLLFQKFTQLDASTTRRFGGTGLGLAICRELAELMGGSVSVESVAGEGSSFSAHLPLVRVAAAAAQVAPAAGAAPAKETSPACFEAAPAAVCEPAAEVVPQAPPEPAALRVLAAEDNPTNQLVLTTVMQIFGLELTLAADGIEAVEAWRAGEFDVVLMDIQMPRQDGVAATRRIRAEEAASGRRRTPILALSANALNHQVEAYLAAGMDGHVAKPIELEKLQAALEEALSGPQAGQVSAVG